MSAPEWCLRSCSKSEMFTKASRILEMLDKKWTETKHSGEEQFIWEDDESDEFANCLLPLCGALVELLRSQPYPYLRLTSPMCVLGDIHGNFDDMHFFLKELQPCDDGDVPPSLEPDDHPVLRTASSIPKSPNSSKTRILHDVMVMKGHNQYDYQSLDAFTDCRTQSHMLSRTPPTEKIMAALEREMNRGKDNYDLNTVRGTSRSLLFLGDYVDRGPCQVEVIAYLLALKAKYPERVFLLRGNHETPLANKRHGFLDECDAVFGDQGWSVWRSVNEVFNFFPLAASIDDRIFCVHAGIPRLSSEGGEDRLSILEPSEEWEEFRKNPPKKDLGSRVDEVAFDMMWSDPASATSELDKDGFGANPNRGPGAYVYGLKAVEDFFACTGFKLLMRAHEHKASGFQIQKAGKVVTIFSASQYCGGDNLASAAYVSDNDEVQIMIREPAHWRADNSSEDDY